MSGYESPVQRAVDEVGSNLGRAVALQDGDLRLIAYSPQLGLADSARLACILSRGATPDVAAWIYESEVLSSSRPTRVRPPSELRMEQRVCAPVRVGEEVLGSLWLLDADRSLTDQDLERVSAVATHIGELLYLERTRTASGERRREIALSSLLSATSADDPAWPTGIRVDEFFQGVGRYTVVVACVLSCGSIARSQYAHSALHRAIMDTLAAAKVRRYLFGIREDMAVVVLGSSGQGPSDDAVRFATRLQQSVQRLLPATGRWASVAGIGSSGADIRRTATSFRQAERSMLVAGSPESPRSVVSWSDLGPLGIISYIPREELSATIPPAILRAFSEPRGRALLETAERYLEHAGDVQATARELHLHRSSLYGRLQKFEDLTGFDLADGNQRLNLHLALKLLRAMDGLIST